MTVAREDLAPKSNNILSRDVSLEELSAKFNITTGHDHDGTDSKKIDWSNIENKPTLDYAFYTLTMPSAEFNTADDLEGSLTVTWKDQGARKVLSAPSNDTGTPSFRELVPNDIPTANLVESTSSVLTITNGTNAIVGTSNLTIQVKEANTETSGYLSYTDWNTFNSKVSGPVNSVDNTVPRFDSTTGKIIQNSSVVIDDNNNVSGVGSLSISEPLTISKANGTAPLVITSTTVVNNLNADLLDGNHASAFATSTHNHDSTYLKLTGGTLTGNILINKALAVIAADVSSNNVLSLQSMGSVEVVIDNNNNDTNKLFSIKSNSQTNDPITKVDETGNFTTAGYVAVSNGSARMEYNVNTESIDFVFV